MSGFKTHLISDTNISPIGGRQLIMQHENIGKVVNITKPPMNIFQQYTSSTVTQRSAVNTMGVEEESAKTIRYPMARDISNIESVKMDEASPELVSTVKSSINVLNTRKLAIVQKIRTQRELGAREAGAKVPRYYIRNRREHLGAQKRAEDELRRKIATEMTIKNKELIEQFQAITDYYAETDGIEYLVFVYKRFLIKNLDMSTERTHNYLSTLLEISRNIVNFIETHTPSDSQTPSPSVSNDEAEVLPDYTDEEDERKRPENDVAVNDI